MLSLRSAAALLAGASSLETLAPIAAAVGCEGAPAMLDAESAEALGLPKELAPAAIVRGAGSLRVLLAESRRGALSRDTLARLARRLSVRAPHLLWLVAATERGGASVALAAWSADRSPPRVAASIANRDRVLDSDAETLCALAAAGLGGDILTHARWLDVLGREALTRRFFRALARLVGEMARDATGGAPPRDRREIAILNVSRLLFLSFLEAKGWLDGDRGFLLRRFTACMESGGAFHRRVLAPLFFGTLNTPVRARAPAARALGRIPFLNGGLFSPTPLERRWRDLRVPDDVLGRLFGELLARYRFTAREDAADWSEAAVDPAMLGRAFESLMEADHRRASGVFYTPHALVERVAEEALASTLPAGSLSAPAVLRALAGEEMLEPERSTLRARVAALRILDPACGSGAFLVHALERLSALAAQGGDDRPLSDVRRDVLTRSIYGVDVSPTAVWLCELRLWLSVVIESGESDPLRVPPLPNLDHHVRAGDSLAGSAFEALPGGRGARSTLARLRVAYARAVGRRKRTLERALEREERTRAVAEVDRRLAGIAVRRRDLLAMHRGRDLFGERHPPTSPERATLAELRVRRRELRAIRQALLRGGALPFTFAAHFGDVGEDGGFDLIVGNPPWVRLRNIPRDQRARLRRDFAVYREAAWESGAAGAQVGRGFAAQVDLAALFVERSIALLRPGGTAALLLPVKLWRALAAGGVRRHIAATCDPVALEDWSESRSMFDAATYPSLLVARKRRERNVPELESMRISIHRGGEARSWRMPPSRLPLDASPGSPWIVVPPDVRAARDALAARGTALARSQLGRPHLGVKSGCNAAFVVEILESDASIAHVSAGGRRGRVEAELLRPLLRGEAVLPWRRGPAREHILWTHASDGAPLERLPCLAEEWLAPWRRRLAARADARGGRRWWTLFRTEAADSARPRVVWADFGRSTRAAVLAAGDPCVPLNSCYVVPCATADDAQALAALLNSRLAAAWLEVLAEPARGGYRRYLGWTMALLPVPADWPRARELLAPLAERAANGEEPGEAELLARVLESFETDAASVAPLLAWSTT